MQRLNGDLVADDLSFTDSNFISPIDGDRTAQYTEGMRLTLCPSTTFGVGPYMQTAGNWAGGDTRYVLTTESRQGTPLELLSRFGGLASAVFSAFEGICTAYFAFLMWRKKRAAAAK